uniref:Uncharacterized protein n=1 Tax=Romanomermis culicivorax TaxID=13658 RepID=A0A915KTT7_ROMCU
GTTTSTAAACAAPVSKAGCCILTTSAGACRCVLTCLDPPACPVWDVEGQFKGTLDTNSPAGYISADITPVWHLDILDVVGITVLTVPVISEWFAIPWEYQDLDLCQQ